MIELVVDTPTVTPEATPTATPDTGVPTATPNTAPAPTLSPPALLFAIVVLGALAGVSLRRRQRSTGVR